MADRPPVCHPGYTGTTVRILSVDFTQGEEMGLRQDFRFRFESAADVEQFLQGLSDTYSVESRNGFFLICGKSKPHFTFDASIEDFGLRSDRAGNYFEFLGILVERLTGQFGSLKIEDT